MSRPASSGCTGLLALSSTPHYQLFLDEGCRLFLARRTAAPFASTTEIVECFAQVERLLAGIRRKEFKLLVDVRNGPARNDPAFEATAAAHRGKLLRGFAKNAALAASAAGRLQIQRYAKDDGREVYATDEPRAALEYLGIPAHPLPR